MTVQELSMPATDTRTPASRRMRFKAMRQRLRIKVFRRLAVYFGRASRFCLQRTRPAGMPDLGKLRKTQHAWRTLIAQFQSREAVRGLLDCGVLGNDLPRVVSFPVADRVLVLAAHQDDETVAAGGTLLLCRNAGATVQAVYVTDGATGFGTFAPQETSRLRNSEAISVWKALSGSEPVFLGCPNRADAIASGAAERLSEIIDRFKPDCIFLPNFLEQPVDHRRINDVLLGANEIRPLRAKIEIWGYQITTRLPGNVAVDITPVWRRKYRINRKWHVPNSNLDYAHLAMGRDVANSYYLKGRHVPKRTAAHAELFLAFEAPEYLRLARTFCDLPEAPVRAADTPRAPDFFIVGMQKSGTYWLTALLDAHPRIRCFPSRPGHADGTGEAHLFDGLAKLECDFAGFRKTMGAKLEHAFRDLVPAEPPADERAKAQLLERIRDRFNEYCHRQREEHGKPLVGEKTTETVHHPDLLDRLYPGVRKVCILRDPRDRAVSFHFHQVRKRRLPEGAPISDEEIEGCISRVARDYEGLLRTSEPCHVLTYEQLSADPPGETASLLAFLGVPPEPATVARMVEQASFERLSGRAPGVEDSHSHFRKGESGDWRTALSPRAAGRITEALRQLTGRVESRFGLDLSAYEAP